MKKLSYHEYLIVTVGEEAMEINKEYHINQNPTDEINDLLAMCEMLDEEKIIILEETNNNISNQYDLIILLFDIQYITSKILRFGINDINPSLKQKNKNILIEYLSLFYFNMKKINKSKTHKKHFNFDSISLEKILNKKIKVKNFYL